MANSVQLPTVYTASIIEIISLGLIELFLYADCPTITVVLGFRAIAQIEPYPNSS